MAITLIQEAHQFSNSATSISVAATGSGNLITIGIAYYNTTPPTSITDDAGNTYVQAVTMSGTPDGPFGTDIWYAKNSIAGATSITVNLVGGGNQADMVVNEWSGADTTNPVEITGTQIESSMATPNQGPPLTTTGTNDLLIAVDTRDNTALFSVDGPWTFDPNTNNNQGYAYYISSSPGTYQAFFQPATNDNYTSVAAAFKAAGAAPTKKPSLFLVF